MDELYKQKNIDFDGDGDFLLAAMEAFCTRLCHDYSGPVASVKAGAELFKEDGNSELLELIQRSVDELSRQLVWIRSTFTGLLAPAANASFVEAIRSVRCWLSEGRIALDESAEQDAERFFRVHSHVEQIFSKIFLLLMADIRLILPRGGKVKIYFDEEEKSCSLRLVIEGSKVMIREDWMKVISGDCTRLSEKTALAFVAALYAKRLHMTLKMTAPKANVLELGVLLPSRP